jgi:hypothetical protein
MGTLLGGLFAFLNKRQDAQIELAKLQHDLVIRDKDIELAREEAKGQMFIASEATEAARFAAIGSSNEADKLDAETVKQAGGWKFLFVLSDAYRRAMRPAITTALLGAALWANYVVFTRLGDAWPSLTPQQQLDIVLQAFGWVTGQASACVAYWMVSRGQAK